MTAGSSAQEPDSFAQQRASMVTRQIEARGVRDERVLAAMGTIPREMFVPEELRQDAYSDRPLGIGYGQTISQPYTVAMMCEALQLSGSEKLLEIGTGSGYAAGVLAMLVREVHTIERIPELAKRAEACLNGLGIANANVHVGDGSLGLPEEAPFDAIVVAAGGPSLPAALREQLSEGGRVVMPVGPRSDQRMVRFTLRHGIIEEEDLGGFCFVPLIGADAWEDI